MKTLGWLCAAVSALALAVLSGVRLGAEPQDGLLRLSWRARGEQVRVCRVLTAAELEQTPVHMRQQEVCERRIVPYRLRVTIDSTQVLDQVVRAGGAHEDRPLFVFFEQPVAAGAHRLRVVFEHASGDASYREAERETPPRLTLDEPIILAPGAIVVVTYDDEGKLLRLLAASLRGS